MQNNDAPQPMAGGVLYLSAPGRFADVAPASEGRPEQIDGQPCSYYWKDLIQIGSYMNVPQQFGLSVDAPRLHRWERTGKLMLAAGLKVPIVCDHSEKARDAMGRVIDYRVDGDRLKALCMLIGEDARRIAARNDVSVGIHPEFVDGQGRRWGDSIVHVALTPVPVVPNQEPFVQAASLAAGETVNAMSSRPGLLTLAASTKGTERKSSMSCTLSCGKETLAALHQLVPGLGDAPDSEKLARVAQHLQTLASCDDEDAGEPSEVARMSRAQVIERAHRNRRMLRAEHARLSQELSASRSALTRMSRGASAPPDSWPGLAPELESALIEAVGDKYKTAVTNGALDQSTAEQLLALTVRDGQGKVNTLCLSRGANPRGDKTLAMAIASALASNRPMQMAMMRESSGMQALSRIMPGDNAEPVQARLRERMIRLASDAKGGA